MNEEIKEEVVKTRVPMLESDLTILGLEKDCKPVEVRNKVRETLKLPKIKKNTQKAQALDKLGLSSDSTHKEMIKAINEKL